MVLYIHPLQPRVTFTSYFSFVLFCPGWYDVEIARIERKRELFKSGGVKVFDWLP